MVAADVGTSSGRIERTGKISHCKLCNLITDALRYHFVVECTHRLAHLSKEAILCSDLAGVGIKTSPVCPTSVLAISDGRHRAFFSLQDTMLASHHEVKKAIRRWARTLKCMVEKISISPWFRPGKGRLVATPHNDGYEGMMPIEEFMRRVQAVQRRSPAATRSRETDALPAAASTTHSLWLTQCTARGVNLVAQSSIAYSSYENFARGRREVPMGRAAFKRAMESEGFPWQHHRLHNRFFGLRVLAYAESETR